MDSKDKKSEQLRVEFDNVKEVSSIKNPMEKRMNSLTPTTSNASEREAMSSKCMLFLIKFKNFRPKKLAN